MNMATPDHICQNGKIAAYLDGQLDESDNAQFEAHLASCHPCRSELTVQRQFMCELDFALSNSVDLPMPKDFARVVSVRAESDMSGVREGGERRRALLACLALGTASFALLGATAGKSLMFGVRGIANKVVVILGLLWTALHDAVTGLTIISRVLGRVLLPRSPFVSLAALVLLGLAVASLSHLIVSYHRRNQTRLFE